MRYIYIYIYHHRVIQAASDKASNKSITSSSSGRHSTVRPKWCQKPHCSCGQRGGTTGRSSGEKNLWDPLWKIILLSGKTHYFYGHFP